MRGAPSQSAEAFEAAHDAMVEREELEELNIAINDSLVALTQYVRFGMSSSVSSEEIQNHFRGTLRGKLARPWLHALAAAREKSTKGMRRDLLNVKDQNQRLRDALTVCLGHLTGGMDGEWRDCDPIALARETLETAKS